MKTNFILIAIVLAVLIPITSSAQTKSGNSNTNDDIGSANSEQVDAVLATPPAVPRGPKQLLQDYETEMAEITHRFSATLLQITDAVQRGELTSEQGQKISSEQYQVAQMQFELLGAWSAMLQQDLDRVPDPGAPAASSQAEDNQVILVALPFSSFQLNPSLAEYLDLSQAQVERIEQVMARERRSLQPLITELQATREKLLAADPVHTSGKDLKALANAQAGQLAKLIVANERMQSEIYKLLTLEQQHKLNDLKRGAESSTLAKK
ncbi:MAG TPA: Spy/CpxP family protein refolding chaperone [Terriglobales bacterium]|jgi:Spy/CpxP family protein refolding chaperone|nr:Spy/CpxP family protein refolding chaperone [Terriglobales bacterium]